MSEGGVLVAGAGPVGLATALELSCLGHPVRVVERDRDYHEESRALGVNPRTLELLEHTGVSARLWEVGKRVDGVEIAFGGGAPTFLPFDVRHRWPLMLIVPQSRTERVLGEALAARGVPVEWERPVTRVRLEADGAPVVTLGPDGEEARPGWLVAADGARSTVRGALDVAWPEETTHRDWGILDARVEGTLPRDRVFADFGADGPLVSIPIEEDVVRLIATRPDPAPLLPAGVRILEEIWRSTFDIRFAVAGTFLTGRVALAGDAAHVHSPVGARGMNLGIEDAVLLARALDADPPAVARWAAERRGKAHTVLRQTRLATRGVRVTSGPARLLRRSVLRAAARVGPLRRAALRRLGGLG
ncbi:MAG: FAD-dependent monooxygenase [Gemmatimonadetes bacterium]|nr:FAD-dependent monooxygenase [Gemmatimonadota bacterium]